jgi:signal transduction histidine kinase
VRLRPRVVTLLATLLAGALTDVVLFVPSLHFAYRSVPVHAMLETAATLIGLLTTFLLWGRLRERRRLDDLLLFLALGVLSVTNLCFAAIPAGLGTSPHRFSTWTTVAGSALGAALLALAGAVPARPLRAVRRSIVNGVLSASIALAVLGSVVAALGDRLPIGLDPARSPVTTKEWIAGNTTIALTQLVIALFFTAAAVGFTRRAEHDRDELLLWLGAGAAVAAVSRVNYFVFPSLNSPWVYTGDAFRLMWHVLLFIGAVREIRIYQRAFADSKVAAERRRIARDLHDGVAQELAFVANTAVELAESSPHSPRLRQVASAAQRGLDESRRAIATLTREADEPFEVALAQAVEEVASRVGAEIEISAEGGIELPRADQEQLLRIVREAVTNAARHAAADVVRVELTNGGPVRVRVEDDGVGFDPLDVRSSAFGLITMRERAAAIGGELRIVSRVGEGTLVEVEL